LNLVLSVCVVALTSFLCVALFYLISSIHKVQRVVKMVEGGVTKAEEVVDLIREKVKSGSAYFMVLGEVAKRAMEYFFDKTRDGKEQASKTKTKGRR